MLTKADESRAIELAERDGRITDSFYDGMPAIAERGYRRGYCHALADLVQAMRRQNLNADDVERWLYGPVWQWRWADEVHSWKLNQRINPTLPPDVLTYFGVTRRMVRTHRRSYDAYHVVEPAGLRAKARRSCWSHRELDQKAEVSKHDEQQHPE
jgi:hypothetical protein